MAFEVPISGGPERAKIRSLWGVALLPIITFGIYYLVWYYKINREMKDLGRKRNVQGLGDSPLMSLVAITIGAMIIVPAIISMVNTYKRIKLSQEIVNIHPGDRINGWIVLLGYLLIAPLAYAYEQDALNKVWEIDSGMVDPQTGTQTQATFQVQTTDTATSATLTPPEAAAPPAPPAPPSATPPPGPPPPPPPA